MMTDFNRNVFMLAALVLLLALPASVHAQEPATIEQMVIRVWPEFDQPSALVFYEGQTAEDVELPATLTFELPEGAALNAAAYRDPAGGGLLMADTQQNGNQVTLTTPNGTFWIEFYDTALSVESPERSYALSVETQHPISSLVYEVQTPFGGTGMQVQPEGGESGTDQYGLPSMRVTETNIGVGETLEVSFSYTKTNDTLTATWLDSANEAAGDSAAAPLPVSATQSQPRTLVIVLLLVGGLALVGGGVYWFLQASKTPARGKQAAGGGAGKRFCAECGTKAQPGDRFCRSCGAKL